MKYRVTKPLPQGQQPGEIVEFNDEIANVFLTVEAIEKVEESKPAARGRYRRSDMRAENAEELTAAE